MRRHLHFRGAGKMTIEELADAIRSGDRAALPRAITLLESTRPDHHEQAQRLLLALQPDSGDAHRVGITGTPGWASPRPSRRSACT